MGFENPIVGGTALRLPAIQSPNYQTGTAGWIIRQDGTAEFADLIIRSSDGSGTTVVIDNGTITITNGSGATVVKIDANGYTLYNATGDIVAQIILDSGGALGGFYCRNFAFPANVYAFLSGGQITSGPVTNALAAVHGYLQYVIAPTGPTYTVQTLSTGAIDAVLDTEARVQLISQRGQRSVCWVDGGSSAVAADLHATADVIAGGDFVAQTGAVLGRGLTASQFLTTTASGITAEAVTMTLTGVAFQTGRAYRLKMRAFGTSTVAGDKLEYRIRKTGLGGTTYLDTTVGIVVGAAGVSQLLLAENICVNNTGSTLTQTLTATLQRITGTGTVSFGASASSPAYVTVEDIGPSSSYVNATALS